MDEVDFTAGITLQDGQVLTVDVTRIDGSGIAFTSESDGPRTVPWSEVKAVMLATVDHMLETGGYLFSLSELVQEHDEGRPYDGPEMRRFALGLLHQAAPRVCPLGATCGLQPPPAGSRGGQVGGGQT